MQESGYKTGTNQLGRDAVSISSLYPGNLGVIAQGYDGSRDSTALSYQGECFFTQPPLASREDTLKFVASSAAKATGKRITKGYIKILWYQQSLHGSNPATSE